MWKILSEKKEHKMKGTRKKRTENFNNEFFFLTDRSECNE